MIKKIFNNGILNEKPSQSITAAAFIIALAGIISRLLGFLRDRILASQFGAGDVLDVYYAAFRIPDFIYAIIISGAVGAAFIPVFTEIVSREKKEKAWEMVSGILSAQVIVLGVLSLLGIIFSPFLMKILAPGFSAEKMEEAVKFNRILMLSPVIWSVSAIFGGMLNSFKKFLISSLAPILYNLGIIFGALVFVCYFGSVGLAWGVILGVLLHALIQYPSVRFSGFHFIFSPARFFSNQDLKRVFYLTVPRALALGVGQVNFMVITALASSLPSGSLTIFNLASNIQAAPIGIFAVSFAVAAFPVLSVSAANKNNEEFAGNFSETLRKILFFLIPLTFFLIILRAQVVRVFLGAGKFDWEDTRLTFETLAILAVSIPAQGAIHLLARSFYAMQNTRTPFYAAIFSSLLNIILAVWWVGPYSVQGLASAFSVASFFNVLALYLILRRKFNSLNEREVWRSVAYILLSASAAGILIQWSKDIVSFFLDIDTFFGIFTQLSVSALLGGGLFIYLSFLLKIEEAFKIKVAITKKIFKIRRIIFEDINQVS